MLNATQQVGGSIGTALLNTFSTSAVAAYLVGRAPSPVKLVEASVHSFRVASPGARR